MMNLAHETCCLNRGTQISDTDILRTSIQEFLNTSIDPYISSSSPSSAAATPLAEDMDSSFGGFASRTTTTTSSACSAMAAHALAHQTSAILTDITSQASMGEDEALEGFGNILRREEPYSSWTMSSSHYVSAELPHFPHDAAFGGGVDSYASFQDLSFSYEPFETVPIQPEPSTTTATATATEWSSGRKGKEILVDEAELVLSTGPSPSSGLHLLQLELPEKFRSSSTAPPTGELLLPGSNPKSVSPPAYRSLGRPVVGEMPPGHSASSLFRPHNSPGDREFLQFPRGVSMKKKRKPLIFMWAMSLAPRMRRSREEIQVAGGSSVDGLSPGTEGVDPRSPNSVAHDLQMAVAHKIAERNRRLKFNHKLQTLISIVPLVNKKKDKVSVLSSTIEYIKQLNLRISALKKVEEEAVAAPSTSRLEAEGDSPTVDREEDLSMFTEPSNTPSSPIGGAPVVVVEGAPGDDIWVIKAEAPSRPRSLIQVLNALVELELGVVSVDYGSLNERFHANICVKNSKNSSTSSGEIQATLCRVLEARDTSGTGSV